MAITVSGLVDGGVFCHDMGDVVLMHASGEVTVKFSVTDAAGKKVSEFEEQYYPNASAEIHISGLSEVMECYLQGESVTALFAPDSNYKDVGGFATLSMAIYESGKQVNTYTQMFFQATWIYASILMEDEESSPSSMLRSRASSALFRRVLWEVLAR